jgi:hypothetical protein
MQEEIKGRGVMRRKLQIFVSSTFTDLIPERQAAVSAILKAGHIPAGMELFTAGDKSQMDTIKRWIDESDVYMLILGGRYGSIEPSSGVSYTELEYDYASEQGKPLFSVVVDEKYLDEKVRSGGINFIERENPQHLKQFRDKVLSKISSFFKSDDDIKLCVHESLADFRDNPELKGWISAAEYEDPKPLHEELARLKIELEKFRSDDRNYIKNKSDHLEDFDEILDYMREIVVKIPEKIRKTKEEMPLSDIFYANKDLLITGVINSGAATETNKFLYFNVSPKLILHGLMANEKVAGVQYRRSFVTPKGLAVLAEIGRRISLAKPKSNAQDSKKSSAPKAPTKTPTEESSKLKPKIEKRKNP